MRPSLSAILVHSLSITFWRIVMWVSMGLHVVISTQDTHQSTADRFIVENRFNRGDSGQQVIPWIPFLFKHNFSLLKDGIVKTRG
jgi:hypothetical protein